MTAKMKYFVVNPGGNITAIVPGIFSVQKREQIALLVLKKNKRIEQVGFWMPVKSNKSVARLEMAGGEFCGNATRSLAALLARKKPFFLEVSGLPQAVKVRALKKRSTVSLPLKGFQLNNGICRLPGITHILEPNEVSRTAAKMLLRSSNLLKEKASGVIGYQKLSSGFYEITPVVWVRDISTLYAETACASGTAALAYYFWKFNGITNLRVKQPSGTIFNTKVKNGLLTVGGPILKISKETLNIP